MKNLWRLLKLFKPYSGWVLLGIFLSTITLLANISLMAVSGWFIASMAIAGMAGVSMNYYTPAAIIRAAAIFRTAGRYAERLITHEATFRLLSSLRVWFYQHLEPLVPAALEDVRSGDLLSHIRSDIDMLNNFYIRVIVPVTVAIIGVTVTSLVMMSYHPLLGVILLVLMMMAGVLLPLIIGQLGKEPGQIAVEQAAMLNTRSVDALQGMAELTVCNAFDDTSAKIAQNSRQWIDTQKKMGAVSGLAQSGLLLFTQLALWILLIAAIPLYTDSVINGPQLVMLALFTLAAFETVMPLPEAFRLMGLVHASATRLFSIIDREPLVIQPETGAEKPAEFQIDFHHVAFRYDKNSEQVLTDVSLQLSPGKKLAIVGATGTGKSSLIQLLLRYRTQHSGEIRLGKRPLAAYRSEQLAEWIAVVPQQVYLFNTTIRQNLLLAKPDASPAELHRVCALAQIDQFIELQPQGLDTWVGETGVKVSGGQARRIAIARALLRDFECLVLDEPGEGLDRKTESDLMTALIDELGDRSLLLITHSTTALQLMDEVMVLNSEKCAEKCSFPRYE